MTRTTDDLDFLIKLVRLAAESTNDGEAINSLRKANQWLKKCGWEWETLLKGKVTVMANPFASAPVAAPPPRSGFAPSAPPRPQAPPPSAYTAPPRPQPQATPASAYAAQYQAAATRTAKPRKSKVTMSAADAADILKNLGL